jgi:hypothetical protein
MCDIGRRSKRRVNAQDVLRSDTESRRTRTDGERDDLGGVDKGGREVSAGEDAEEEVYTRDRRESVSLRLRVSKKQRKKTHRDRK